MKKYFLYFTLLLLAAISAGCCIMSRNIVTKTKVLKSDYYIGYTNGVMHVFSYLIDENGNEIPYTYVPESIYYKTSYMGGPYRGSLIYPATRNVLNILSMWSYSSAAGGDYMNNIVTLPTYPLYIVELPIQLVLDTVLLPFDLLNQPRPPEGYQIYDWWNKDK